MSLDLSSSRSPNLKDWILQMHSQHGDEINCGDDDPIFLVTESIKQEVHNL